MDKLASDILIRFQAGDLEAFGLLVERYRVKMYRLGLRMFMQSADAEDFAQDVFLRVYEKRKLFDARRPFEPWLYRLAVNHGREKFRRRRRQPVLLGDKMPEVRIPPLAEQALLDSERNRRVWAAMEQLDEKYRVCLALRLEAELSLEEIARTLALPLGTVKSQLNRGLKHFLRHYRALEGDPQCSAKKVAI